MKLEEIKKIALNMDINPGRMKKVELIRAIQQGEHNPCCFETGQATACGQVECLWRPDCV